MKVSFFPGCSLEGTAREYGESIEAVCTNLNIELEEVPDWNCCGASSAHRSNEYLSVALPARSLNLAENAGRDLVTPCAACFNRLKMAEKALTGDSKMDVGIPFDGSINIVHILDYLCRDDSMKEIESRIKRPLTNLKAVSYYGCLLVRPPETLNAENWENPETMDNLFSCLGGESISWPFKTECCGASLVLTRGDIVGKLSGRILDMAKDAGAECIITACPMCQSNLDTRQDEIGKAAGITYDLPIFYFTELLGLALGHKSAPEWFGRHIVDPRNLLTEKKLID